MADTVPPQPRFFDSNLDSDDDSTVLNDELEDLVDTAGNVNGNAVNDNAVIPADDADDEVVFEGVVSVKPRLGKCIGCCKYDVSHVYAPCGHAALCEDCGAKNLAISPTSCPLCRQPFTNFMRVYFND